MANNKYDNIILPDEFLKGTRPGEYTMNCPHCITRSKNKTADEGYHLGINVIKGIFHCHRCGVKGKVSDFGQFEMFYQKDQKEDDTYNSLSDSLSSFQSKSNEETFIDLDQISNPLNKEDTPMSYSYVRDRGFTDEDIIYYNMRSGKPYKDKDGNTISRWRGRIIFPFMKSGKCKYAVGRTYIGSDPKYMNTLGFKSDLVYNIDRVKNRVCIVCEGIISSIAAEKNTGVSAVAILGKFVSNSQADIIRSHCDSIYLCLDGDTNEEETQNAIKTLRRTRVEINLIRLPRAPKDPDELGPKFKEYFDSAELISII